MKTPEEYWDEYESTTELPDAFLIRVQFDALTKAAEIAGATICGVHPDCGSIVCDVQAANRDAILAFRDSLPASSVQPSGSGTTETK